MQRRLPRSCSCPDAAESDEQAPPTPRRRGQPEDFPRAKGKTLAEMRKRVRRGRPGARPSVSRLTAGSNRFGFGLFDGGRAQIADAPGRLRGTGGRRRGQGPFPARYESLAVKPQFQSRGVEADPDSAKSVYVADVEFPEPGSYEMLGLARLDDRLVAATPAGPPLQVVADDQVADVGERAPRISTPDQGVGRRATWPRSTPATRPRRCTTPTSPTCWGRSRSCCCSPRRRSARAGCAARWWTSPSR